MHASLAAATAACGLLSACVSATYPDGSTHMSLSPSNLLQPSGGARYIPAQAGGAPGVSSDQSQATTRFGMLSMNGMNVLLLNGRPVQPTVQGNNRLFLMSVFPMGDRDAVVVQNYGGSACPTLYTVVMVSASGARPSKEFGTCAEVKSNSVSGNAVVLTMTGFRGPGEPQASQMRAFHESHVFRVVNGAVTDNGRPAR